MRSDLLIRARALQRLDMPWYAPTTLWARDPELARMTELIEMGDQYIARRVSACGQLVETKKQHMLIPASCNRRECLKCVAQRLYPRYRRRIAEGARQMRNPTSIRFSVASVGEHDLESGINLLRSSLPRIRRLRSMRDVPKGVGLIHPAHARNNRWHPHVHLLIDAPENFDVEAVERDWQRLTKGWGHVELRPPDPKMPSHETRPGDPGDVEKAADYIARSADWAPDYGALPLAQYAVLRKAIEGRQLLVAWGLDGRGKKGSRASAGDPSLLNNAHARLAATAKRRHAASETVEWDLVEERDDVIVECVFRLHEGRGSPSRVVRDAFLGWRRPEVVEYACTTFLALPFRPTEEGRRALMEILAYWLGLDFGLAPRPTPPQRTPTDAYRIRLSDGPPDARGDCSPFDYLFLAIGHAMLMAELETAEEALELIAVVWLAEILRDEPASDPRRATVLRSMHRLLGMRAVPNAQ